MSTQYEYTAKLKVVGDLDRLQECISIIKSCQDDEGVHDFVSLLRDKGILMGLCSCEIDISSTYLGVLAFIFCDNVTFAESIYEIPFRSFIRGCDLFDDVLSVYYYGPDDEEEFFNKMVGFSSLFLNVEIEEEDDDDYDEVDDYYDEDDYEEEDDEDNWGDI